jgi:hypothetical protein
LQEGKTTDLVVGMAVVLVAVAVVVVVAVAVIVQKCFEGAVEFEGVWIAWSVCVAQVA